MELGRLEGATGETRCTGEVLESCGVGASGCTDWEVTSDCASTGEACEDAAEPGHRYRCVQSPAEAAANMAAANTNLETAQ